MEFPFQRIHSLTFSSQAPFTHAHRETLCMEVIIHPPKHTPSCIRGCSNYDNSFSGIRSGQLQVGPSLHGTLPFCFCCSFSRCWSLTEITSIKPGLLLFQDLLLYLLCLVSLKDISGLDGLHLAILLRDTSILQGLLPEETCSGL